MEPTLTLDEVRRNYALQKHAERWQDKPKERERPPGPLKLAMLREPTAEELRIAELDRKAEAQRRVCKPVANGEAQGAGRTAEDTGGAQGAGRRADSARPAPWKRWLVELCKCKQTYWLEYHKSAKGAPWVLVDVPPQLEALATLPVEDHGPWLERMCYTVVEKQVK